MAKILGMALLAMVLGLSGETSAEPLDQCAAEMWAKFGGGRGTPESWYPVCRELQRQEQRVERAREKQRDSRNVNPANAAEPDVELEDCLRVPNPTWEGKPVSRRWWEAHCRWSSGQPGATRPPLP